METMPLYNKNSAIHCIIFHSPACIALSEFLLKNVIWFPTIDNWNLFYLKAVSSQMKHRRTWKKEIKAPNRIFFYCSWTYSAFTFFYFTVFIHAIWKQLRQCLLTVFIGYIMP